MTDKETATGGGQHNEKSATVLQLPSLTSKPTKQQLQQEANNATRENDSPSGGYYFNVAQKGKLILPTALWILLIVAGVAFLTLLASLNRTIDTLDTLVELEQEKESRASLAEHLRHLHSAQQQQQQQQEEAAAQSRSKSKRLLKSKRRLEEEEEEEEREREVRKHGVKNDEPAISSEATGGWTDALPVKASWFALPNWTSLDPVPHPPPPMGPLPPPPPPELESMLDNIMGPRPGPQPQGMLMPPPSGPSMPDEISGAQITISSQLPMPYEGGPSASGMVRSMMEQVLPMIDSIVGPQSKMQPQEQPGWPQVRAPHFELMDEPSRADATGGPMISAKIDNLNINLNADDESERSHSSGSRRRPSMHDEETNLLEKSIDDLVGKLMEQKSNRVSDNEMVPIIRLPDAGPRPSSHKHPHHQRPAGPFSPLASFLSRHPMFMDAGDSSPPAMIIGPLNGPSDLESLLMGLTAGSQPPPPHISGLGGGHPEAPQVEPDMIISIASDSDREPSEPGAVSGETNRHGVSNTRRPNFGQSPYELPVLQPFPSLIDNFRQLDELMSKKPHSSIPPARPPQPKLQKSKDDAMWNVLSNDLADSLLKSVLQSPASAPDTRPTESIVMMNGKQLTGDERDKFMSSVFGPQPDEHKTGAMGGARPSGSDLLSLILEPARGPSKVVFDEPKSTEDKSSKLQQELNVFVDGASDGAATPAPNATVTVTKVSTATSELPANKSQSIPPANTISSATTTVQTTSTKSDPADLVENLFSLSQFSGSPQEASTGGGGSSGSSGK